MPSGPEGVQEISEHTLMHPKTHKMTGFYFALLFPSTVPSVRVLLGVEPGRRCLQVNADVIMCPLLCLLLYCYLLHYYVLNWFSLTFKKGFERGGGGGVC